MDLGLQDRVAFVAGASSGLGWAVARQLAEEGARVAIASRSRERIEEAAQRIRDAVPGATVLPVVADVTDESAIIAAFEETIAAFGGLNVLVTNAGGPPSGPLSMFDADAWRNALDLNLVSTINLCRHALPYLETAAEAGLARILMITSISAKQPIPGLALSNTARAGVQGYAKSLAEEVGPKGITVNTVLPGYTKTDRLGELTERIHKQTGQSHDDIEAGWAEANALKRLASPDEFAAAVVFLASAQASYITGTGMVIDGGRSKHII
ncbi:MAG: SDR family oxidoreductase [Rhodothermales bacterium]